MAGSAMTLRSLRVATLAERKEGRLVKLAPDFYARLAELEKQLEQTVAASRDDPTRFQHALAEHHRFSELRLELYKHRERKLMDLAREQVNGQSPSQEAVEEGEQEFLDALCGVLYGHRHRMLVSESVELPPLQPEADGSPATTGTATVPAAAATIAVPAAPTSDEGVLLLRVLEDLPTFTGIDARNYTLKAEDVVTLPLFNARVLLESGAVERIGGD